MIDIEVKVDTHTVTLFLKGVRAETISKASARALNKVIVSVRQEAVQHVHRVRRMKKGAIKKSMVIVRATRRILEARINASNRPVSLKEYSAKVAGKKGHKRVIVNVTGQRKVLEHAFILPNKGGHVFERISDKALPIKKLFGPSIGSALIKSSVRLAINQVIKKKWPVVFAREMQFEINKRNGR